MQQKNTGLSGNRFFSRAAEALQRIKQPCFFALGFAAGFILLVCTPCRGAGAGSVALPRPAGPDTDEVSIEHDPQWNATVYTISGRDCTIAWMARNSEIGVIKHSAECTASLSEQVPLLEKICAEFFSKDKNAQALRTLFWGRLEPDIQNGSRELSLRLALAAHKSPGWDAKRGRPKNGDINGFVRDLANREMIYPELKELFARFHRSITCFRAEKVLVLKADQLPFYKELRQQGVSAAEKLPFDCMTWFSIAAASQK